ncbi:PTS sugar transporter subunit IIA [Candidatus Electronema sp. JM]|uniref:PTS sugar transporter subunit IIA n=1 Tax=Candidatus Electronema sp. JM TaxID=3401571 RepID=UPI003AA9902A
MAELTEEGIILELKAKSKDELLRELAAAAQRLCPDLQAETVRRVLLEREQIGSTGVGNGIAIPHGKLAELQNLLICFGRSAKGIPYEAKDRLPVHLFVMILSPENMAAEYLQTLGQISRLLKDESIRGKLLQAASAKSVQQLFSRAG